MYKMNMPLPVPKNPTERLKVGVTPQQSHLVPPAVRQTEANLSSFLVENAVLRADEALASQAHFVYEVYEPKQWNAFLAALDRPAQVKPELKSLLAEPSILEK